MIPSWLPADVPKECEGRFLENFEKSTGGSGRLMLFAGDQKVEHLNDDFHGEDIPEEDNDPEHMFKIASRADIGVFATQFGLISRYGRDYRDVPYLVKLNSKTNLVPYSEKDPYSRQWLEVADVERLKEKAGLDIRGVGYTVYLGGGYEHAMLREAAQIVLAAHERGLLAVLWIYPKGPYVKDEHDAHLIAGAAGVGACLGADFVKLKVPYINGPDRCPLRRRKKDRRDGVPGAASRTDPYRGEPGQRYRQEHSPASVERGGQDGRRHLLPAKTLPSRMR